MEELDKYGIPIRKQNTNVTLDKYGIPIKKKEALQPTAIPPKSGSGTPTGSSGGVNSAFKSSIASPIPDFNNLQAGKVVEKPAYSLKKPAILDKKEDNLFFDYLKENLDTGLATVSKSLYDAPGLVYDATASITNPLFEAMGVDKSKLASSDKLADDLGFKNIPSNILKEKIKISNEKINAYSEKNGGDALAALESGNYSGAAKLVAGTTMQSLPIMVAAMASGGQTSALVAIGVSTASTKNAQLKEENPEMGLGTRVLNATNAGIIEAVTGHLFTGASGAVMKKILADKGVEAGSKIIGKSFRSTVEKAIEKNPLVGAVGEVIEESAVEFGNQVNDMASGIRTEFDVHAIKNAGLSATGMGGLQTLGVYGAKGYVKAKDYAKLKSTNKEVFKLRSEIENGNLSDENKAVLGLRADRLEAENKKLLGTEIEKAKALPTEQKTELNALNAEFEDLKSKFDDIDDADDIPDNLKPAMKEEIKLQASKNQKRKTEILSQNDGVVIDNDFSKFEGVEPDFDLENGKISSLPLKEQDRLNDQALQELTGGDMSIEVTKEQVSQKANEIYANEQNPQAEAEKVAEVSPVEDVVSPSVEKPISLQEENVSMDNNLRKEKQLEIINKSNPAPNNHNTWVRSIDDIKTANEVFETAFNEGEMYPDFTVDDMKESLNSGEVTIYSSRPIKNGSFVTPSRMNAEEYAGGQGSKTYSKTIKIDDIAWIDESEGQYAPVKETKNAKTPTSNITPDGNVRPTATNVGESGIAIEESPAKKGVPNPVDGGEGKGDVEVGEDFNEDDIANFLNAEFGAKKPVETPKAEVVKPKKEVVQKQEKVAQAKGFVSLAVNKLTTSLKDFQGRAKKYSQQTYDRIVNEAKEGKLNISSIPPIQIWNNPDTGKFVILAGHSRTKAFADLADGKVAFSDKYKKSDFTNVNAQIVEAETLEEAQKIAKESNQGAVQTVVDNAKYVRESLLPTFSNKNQAKTKLRALYGASWARIYAYANLNPKGKAMQMLKQFENANEGTSDDSSKRIAEWTGKARSDFEQLTDAHENEIFDHLLKNDKVKTYEEFSQLLNNRVNGLEQFDANEPLNFESKVGRGSNEVEVLKEIQDFKNREAEIKKSIKKLQANGKQITDSQRQEIRNLTAEAIKINTVDIPNAQKKQKQAKEADANQFDIFSQINEQIENGNITPEQVDEFVNDDRKAAEIEPIVEAIEIKAKSDKKAELEEVVAEVNNALQGEVDNFDFGKLFDGSLDNNENELTQSEIQVEKDKENEEMYQKSSFDKKWAKTYKEATEKLQTQIKDAEAVIEKWSAKVYKKGAGNKFVGGELEGKNVNLDRVNENRRDKAIKNAQQDIIQAKKDLKELGVSDVEAEVVDNENVPTAYHENFKKEFPNTLLAIEEQNGLITIFEDGKSREIEGHKFFEELKKAIEKGYKGIGKVTRKAVETESKKLLANAKIDKVAAIIKKATKADINPDDYHNNGFAGNQDKLIDLIADAAKKLVSAKIDLDEAIRQVIESIKAKFGEIDIDIEAVKQKTNPKAEEKKADNDFKSQEGKKSLLNRAFEGGNSQTITDAIEANGLDYRIENREEAKKRAEDFVNQVGTASALEAVRSNQIKGAEKAFVYSTIVDNLMNEIEGATNESDKQALEKIHADLIADLTNEFSQEGTDAGRFISALNDIYNSSTLKYNLSKQIESHKAANNGEISDEVLAKFTEADKRIKELETLIKEAEAKAKVAEDELAIKNVQEDIERKKQLANKNKSGLTPKEQTRKKELKNKFFGRFNDVTSMVTMLADPEFREYLGLTFKQAKGDLDNFSKRIIAELGKGAKAHLPQLFDEAGKSAPGKSTTIKIGKDGKIKIPAQLFRDYVEAGENDIDVIAAKIKEDIAAEFPDVDVRDVRDALSNYGKQVNPPKDDIVAEISRLRTVGKLISAYEDALQGISPLKSGLKRVKPTQQMRELRKEINRLMKENGLDAVDLEKEWASALDKVKAQLKNQIEDLDKQIAAGEKRKVERTTTVLDAEADALKTIRDAKKQILDDLVGKPELTEEQLIARAEKSLQTSIDKLQKDIADGKIEYNKKPTQKQSAKLDAMRKIRKDLVETKNKMREDAGLVEAKRMDIAKQRVKNQIAELKQKVIDRDYSKKVVKPLIDDSELAQLRAEKLRQQEVYDAQKYKDELKNRTTVQKWSDAALELWNIERIIRATGELSTVLIQGGMLTVSRKFTNPKQLGIIMNKLFTSLGSAKKAERMENLIKAHPDYPLAMKAKLALANTDYKSDVREEQFTGDYANFAWDLPMLLARVNSKVKKTLTQERTVLGDYLLNPIKRATGLGKVGTDKISIKDQWRNANPFRVLERGSTLYMNTLRMEEFVRGVEMLRMEGKNEIDHLADYKLLANAVNSMTGRANLPSQISSSSKALAVVFFSARNAVAVVNQVNPIYYGYLHFGSTDGFQMKKTSVANKLAVTNFIRFVTITGAMILAIKAGAGDDDEGKEVVEVELDRRSSDFMKIKIGNIRFDPWHGMTGPVVLMAKVLTEEVKNINSGKIEKLEDKAFGDKTRLDLLTRFARNKFSPSMARIANTLSTNAGIDPETGEAIRVTPFGENYETEGSFTNVKPMYWDAVKEIRKENPGALAEFLTVVSTFGWNTSVYGQKEKDTPENKFIEDQRKKKALFELPAAEKDKIRVEDKLSAVESKIRMAQALKIAQQKGLPYYHSKDVFLTKEEVAAMDFTGSDEEIEKTLQQIEKIKLEYGIEEEE